MATKEELRKEIQDAIKSGNVVIGYRESLELIKNGTPRLVVLANNAPENKLEEITHNVQLSSVELDVFDGDSKELGLICGKPFPVLVLVIKK